MRSWDQHWKVSLLESLSNTFVGFFIALCVWYGIRMSGLWEINTTVWEGVEITLIFTVVSILRGFGLRRFYNWQHDKLERIIREHTS